MLKMETFKKSLRLVKCINSNDNLKSEVDVGALSKWCIGVDIQAK